MADIFVSYKAEDRRRVQPLVQALQADGYSVWWDAQIGGGTAWRHSIETELNAAKCVVVVWSNRSVGPEGTFVQDEATRAQQRHVYVPVLIDKVHLPLGFGETQALQLTGWHGNRADPRYRAVLSAVQRNVGGEAPAKARPASRTSIDRRAVLAGGAVATVAIAGVGGWTLLRPSPASAGGIAVLPFANLSGDPAEAYFSDGIAEEIRSALARIAGLKVVGRTSSEAVRNDDAETAAKKLGVDNILTGSVRQSPSTIRVSAELIDGHTGLDRWSQDYDRNPGDAIKIQTDIAEKVATALTAALGGAVRAAIAVGGTQNVAAQKLLLQATALASGMTFAGQTTEAAFRQALFLLDQAIAADPHYADAYAHKAVLIDSFADHYGHGGQDLARSRSEAMSYAQRAISLAPNLPYAHLALASLHRSNLELPAVGPELQKALNLAPSDPEVLRNYSVFESISGKSDEAISLADRALGLDPLNGISYGLKMLVLFAGRRYADGVRTAQQAPKDLFVSWIRLGDCLQMLGRNDEAFRAYESAPRDDPLQLAGEGVLAARTGNRTAALAKIERLRQLFGDGGSYQFGQIYAQLGDKDNAFANLEHGFEIKDPGMVGLKTDPWLDPLRSDPRFATLLQKMNFPA